MAQRISLTNVLPLIAVVTVVLGKFGTTSNRDVSLQRVRAVRLNGGHMEIIEEETCSRGVMRLTCRSLRASLLVLEATYQTNHSNLCRHRTSETNYGRKNTVNFHAKMVRHLGMRGNYMDDYQGHSKTELADLRLTLNRRCSGLQHCRFNVHTDHPEAVSWTPANLRLKYACIPDAAIGRYCNSRLLVTGGDGSYLKSPGYPLYYPGGSSCGWTFESPPGQRISLTLYDLNLRSAEQDGSCVDVIRIRERGVTLLESCGTAAGVQVVSESNVITLDLIALGNLYPSRGFLLRYKAVGCPQVNPPNGSYVVNDTGEVMTFLCKVGTSFSDSKLRTRIIRCKNGIWMNTGKDKGDKEQSCVSDSSAAILKAERENGRYTSLSEESGSAGFFPPGGVVERSDDAVAMNLGTTMDPGRSAMVKQGDYVVDVVLPTVLIALLFIGNAIIVYVIFQFRKRKQPELSGEEMALRGNDPQGLPQV